MRVDGKFVLEEGLEKWFWNGRKVLLWVNK